MNALSLRSGSVSVPGSVIATVAKEREKSGSYNHRNTAKSSVQHPFQQRNQLRRMVEKDSNEEIEPRRIPVPVATKAVAVEPSVPEVTVFMDGEFDDAPSAPQNPTRQQILFPAEHFRNDPQRRSSGPARSTLIPGQPPLLSGQQPSLSRQNQPLQGQQGLLQGYYGLLTGQLGSVSKLSQPLQGPQRSLSGKQGPLYEQNRPIQGPQESLSRHQGSLAMQQRPLQVQQGPMSSQHGVLYSAPSNKLRSGNRSSKVDGNLPVSDDTPVFGFPGAVPAFNYPPAPTPPLPPQQYVAAYPPYSHQQNLYQPIQYRGSGVFSPEAPYVAVASSPYVYPQQQYPIDPNWPLVFRPPTPVAQVGAVQPPKPQSILRNPLPKTTGNMMDAHSSGSTDSGLQDNDSINLLCGLPQRVPSSVQPSPTTNIDVYHLYMEQKAEIEKLRQEIKDLRADKEKQGERNDCAVRSKQCSCEMGKNFQSKPPARCSVGVNTTQFLQSDADNTFDRSQFVEGNAFQDQSVQAQKFGEDKPVNTSIDKESVRHLQDISPASRRNDHGSPCQEFSRSQTVASGPYVRLESSIRQLSSCERRSPINVQRCLVDKDNSSHSLEGSFSSQNQSCNSKIKLQKQKNDQPAKSSLSKNSGELQQEIESRSARQDFYSPYPETSQPQMARDGQNDKRESSAKQMTISCSRDVMRSSPVLDSSVDQGKRTQLSGAAMKPVAEESDLHNQTEAFGEYDDARCDGVVENWLDHQFNYVNKSDRENEFLAHGQTMLSMLSTYSVDQSSLDQTFLPRIEYVAKAPVSCGASEMTIAADALAMKYLSDDALVKLHSSRQYGRAEYKPSQDASEVDPWDHQSNQMSFASRKYLQKHGLLPTTTTSSKSKARESVGIFEISTDDEPEAAANGVNVAVFFQRFPNASDSRNSLGRSDASTRKNANFTPNSCSSPFYGSSRPKSNVLDRTLDLVGEVVRDSSPQNRFLDPNSPGKGLVDSQAVPSAVKPGVDLILDFNMNNFPKLL